MTDTVAYVTEVVKRGLDDWIQAAEVVSVVQSLGGNPSFSTLQSLALDVIVEILRSDLMKAGYVTNGAFCEWHMTTAEAVDKITNEWNDLDGFPQLGEICWLSNTDAGDIRARAH